MIGRFLEISVSTNDIQASLEFYERLGFEQAVVGEIWSHHYAVVTDGRLFLGLHQYEFASPALTFVLPDLENHLTLMQKYGIDFEFIKTGDEQFNEAGFFDPDGQMVTILEARTFSPLPQEPAGESLCGHFSQYTIPTRNIEAAIAFWEPMGFVTVQQGPEPFPWASLTSDLINLGFYETPELKAPALTFVEPDMDVRLAKLEFEGFEVDRNIPGKKASAENGLTRSPEGLDLLLLTGQY